MALLQEDKKAFVEEARKRGLSAEDLALLYVYAKRLADPLLLFRSEKAFGEVCLRILEDFRDFQILPYLDKVRKRLGYGWNSSTTRDLVPALYLQVEGVPCATGRVSPEAFEVFVFGEGVLEGEVRGEVLSDGVRKVFRTRVVGKTERGTYLLRHAGLEDGERRKERRRPVSLCGFVYVGEREYPVQLTDVSESGVGFVVFRPVFLEEGERVFLKAGGYCYECEVRNARKVGESLRVGCRIISKKEVER